MWIPKAVWVSVKGTTSLNDPDKTETESEPVSVNFSCELKGGSYLTQNLNAQVEMVNGDETLVLTAAKDGTYDGKQLTGGLDLEMKSTGAMSEEWKAAFDGSSTVTAALMTFRQPSPGWSGACEPFCQRSG